MVTKSILLKESLHHPIIVFDGVCNLCNGFVQWIIRVDKKNRFKFATLQNFENTSPDDETVYLFWMGKEFTHSDVALEVFQILGSWYQPLYVLKCIPKIVRDAIYKWIAKNRYTWFGKKATCMVPAQSLTERFYN